MALLFFYTKSQMLKGVCSREDSNLSPSNLKSDALADRYMHVSMVASVSWAITRKSFRPSASSRLIVKPQVHGPRGMLLGQSGLTVLTKNLAQY
jgi:hypothetical protein